MALITKILLASVFLSTAVQAMQSDFVDLQQMRWNHGSESCVDDQNPPIQVELVAPVSYVFRQNKCSSFEAPFIYLLLGKNTALVVDSGAIELANESPVYSTVKSLYDKHRSEDLPDLERILVVHSHSHSDHTKGDSQFAGQDNIEIVATGQQALEKHLGITDWPKSNSMIDLGDRQLTVIPIPGHQEQSIAIYDHQTQWLLTGDTLYPGVVRVKNWEAYRDSIGRLVAFAMQHPVSLVLGAHIEMNGVTKKPYKIGATYQPEEMPLALTVSHLEALNQKLQQTKKPKKIKFDSFVISPLSFIEKLISNAANKIMSGN